MILSHLDHFWVYLLGVVLEHQVLLALVQSAFLQRPEMKNSVFSLEKFAEDS